MSRNPRGRMYPVSSLGMSRNADPGFSLRPLPRVFRPEEERVRNVQVEPFCMLNVACSG